MRFRLSTKFHDRPVVEEEKAPQDAENTVTDDKETAQVRDTDSSSIRDDHNVEFQRGDEAIRAMTQIWTKRDLIIAYVLIWFICFVQAFSSGIIGTMTPYVTSSFGVHSLTSTMGIVANLMSGLIKLPYAKLLNIWGRPQSFGLMIIVITLGLVMMAACNSVYVYAAALVFYNVGYSTINFTTTIFIADTSSLKSRAFMIAFASSPYLATVWAYGPAAQSALDGFGFRWGLGIWAIVYPVVCTPLWALFYFYQRKAEKAGLIKKEPSGRTLVESIIYWAKEFDIIGILLVATGLALFLLSFSIYTYQKDQWKSPLIICFFIFGGLLIISFALWEKYLAPVTFIPWHLIKNRTVFFTYTMMASIYTAWYIWDNYFYSLLIVVFQQSVTHATYITNIYTVGATFIALVMGVVIRINGRLKWQALYFGVPLTALGVGLMIKFRQPDSHIGFIVMCQIFISFGGGILVICEQMTVMAVSTQRDIPAVLAMESMIASMGASIGDAIAAAMWTSIFPSKLKKYLPESAMSNFANIYGDLTVQSSYPVGSPARDAINMAYGDTQRLMLITATCMYSITLASVMMWKNINVKKIKQVEGVVW
ncbi:major facilitator superfamily domain-containing protein [Ilyonectria sp. MPI-CAGE-AT-0026]|nr:major facilitator superfamily domain-containing protein [Ilyonectria sp. MPI-CAGE-AT-0026]